MVTRREERVLHATVCTVRIGFGSRGQRMPVVDVEGHETGSVYPAIRTKVCLCACTQAEASQQVGNQPKHALRGNVPRCPPAAVATCP